MLENQCMKQTDLILWKIRMTVGSLQQHYFLISINTTTWSCLPQSVTKVIKIDIKSNDKRFM